MRVAQAVVWIWALLSAVCLPSEVSAEVFRRLICEVTGYSPSDQELFERAFAFELATKPLAREYAEMGLEGLQEANDYCCDVDGDDERNWIDTVLVSRSIRATIGWSMTTVAVPEYISTYYMDACGRVVERMGDSPQDGN